MQGPLRNRRDAKLLVASRDGALESAPRSRFADLVSPGDLVVANDAATLPASLAGRHERSGRSIELRLARRASFDDESWRAFQAVVFGEGDSRLPTERRLAPPALIEGDVLLLGPLEARVTRILGHPRFVEIEFRETADAIREGLARHGRPVQYAHVARPLALWDVWTCIAGPPVAFEAPSAGFILDWALLSKLARRGARFATLTHAAGLSSTGDAALDARFPLDEPYDIPAATALAVADAKRRSARVIATGTSVARALEHAATADGYVRPGPGVATQRIGAASRLHVVDAIVTGVHEPGDSHFDLLRAFAGEGRLATIRARALADSLRGHEFGDWMFVDKDDAR